jgi:acyl-CoA synthetase (AMP-forming)/AMP-acid ligase II
MASKGEVRPLILSALINNACDKFPQHKALIVSGKFEVTYAELQRLVNRCAAMLRNAGIGTGDVVALTFPNSIEYVILFFAVLRARAIVAPLNPACTEEELEFYLEDSGSKMLIVPTGGNSSAETAATKLGLSVAALQFCIDTDRNASVEFHPRSKILLSEDSEEVSETVLNLEDDKALFLHTSGTTSRPKGVPLTQVNLAASTQHIINVYELSPSDVTVVVLPFFHVHGLVAAFLSSMVAGGTVVIPSAGRFSATTFWNDMITHGATWYTAVPTVHQILLERHNKNPRSEYPKLRFIRSCSASLAPASLERLEQAFGAPVLEAYAMTEASHLMTSNPLPHRGVRKPGSVGKAVGQELAILDHNGVVQEPGCSGEVCVRGLNVTKGYQNNPEANETAFKFGWFHTGDLGYLDEDGYLFLIGRIKELINRGGEKISPMEVDTVLLSHPAVAEAVAFGVPDDKYGEEINAAVVPKQGATVTESEIMDLCQKNLVSFKIPKRVFITGSIPKTATGKVQRRLVAEHLIATVSAGKVPKFGS